MTVNSDQNDIPAVQVYSLHCCRRQLEELLCAVSHIEDEAEEEEEYGVEKSENR